MPVDHCAFPPHQGLGVPDDAVHQARPSRTNMMMSTSLSAAPHACRPSVTSALPDSLTHAQTDFMSRLALQLGLPVEDGDALIAPHLFTGPAGLACRVHLQEGDPPAVRPEALLPMSAQELAGSDVQRLLAVQSIVLGELGWFLTTSPEGLLQLTSLAWINDPVDAATALDLVNGVGMAILHALMLDDPRLGQTQGLSN
ncbi:hypothetical protein [Hydrogenophaga taeniospiralis]|nr:hypothetical protein [Hydrogenophaga taeniospiralis]